METMKKVAVVASGLLAGSAAFATETFAVDVSSDVPVKRVELSRAEILADLQVWRASGMEAISRSDSYAWTVAEYDKAYARYLSIRGSEDFKVLVQRIEADPKTGLILRD